MGARATIGLRGGQRLTIRTLKLRVLRDVAAAIVIPAPSSDRAALATVAVGGALHAVQVFAADWPAAIP